MSEGKHTPGPWELMHTSDDWIRIGGNRLDKGGRFVADCCNGATETLSEDVANAHLIAAAPELLEALDKSAKWIETAKFAADVMEVEISGKLQSDLKEVLKLNKAAIQKAKGQS